jgi:ubiquinone/menaquinone biosynthesis C-methylase UbiE
MMDKVSSLSKAEEQILDAVLSLEIVPRANSEEVDEGHAEGDTLLPVEKNLRKRGQLIQDTYYREGASPLNWSGAFERLLEKSLIRADGFSYHLTDSGRRHANRIRAERIGNWFSDKLIRSERSKAYSKFCQRVFGEDLCQADLMDMPQLDKLLEVLDLSAKNRVLDLACGIGAIAEYISDTTGAYVLGIDFARGAIQRAQERTHGKRERLEFRVGNMNHLDLSHGSVDTVIAIAALHYAKDLGDTIRQLVGVLSPDGQMGFFTFQYALEGASPDALLPENTNLARALKNNGLHFQAWDYTQQEIEVWRRQLQVARELMEEFREEGNLDLCRERIEECEIDLPRLEAGQKRRYLYHVRLQ